MGTVLYSYLTMDLCNLAENHVCTMMGEVLCCWLENGSCGLGESHLCRIFDEDLCSLKENYPCRPVVQEDCKMVVKPVLCKIV